MTDTISEIESILKSEYDRYCSNEPNKGPVWRWAIASSQVGHLIAHCTHDPLINPTARPFGTKDGEKLDFGHAIIQLLIYGISRELPLKESINLALEAIKSDDWKCCENKNTKLGKGICACTGICKGFAYVDPFCEHIDQMPHGSILVASHPINNVSHYIIARARGVITDNGGMNCHVGIIAREYSIPCIVGTGNVTSLIKTGDIVSIENGVVTITKKTEDGV